jgi:predicted nucleic acid-binding protein
VLFADTNILLRSVHTSDPQYAVTERALTRLRQRGETLCIAPQNVIEFWSVATRPQGGPHNGLGLAPSRAAAEIKALLRLFSVLPYKPEVLDTWRRIVERHGVIGTQAHDAHLVAMMQAHSITSILTFNGGDFTRYPGITVLDPAKV